MKKILSYLVSFWYKITFDFRGITIDDRFLKTFVNPPPFWWRNQLPWDPDGELHGETITTYGLHGYKNTMLSFYVDPHDPYKSKKNVCPWLLNLEEGMLQEIDVVEFMNGHCYFSVYWNDKSAAYRDDKGNNIYRRFQVKRKLSYKCIFTVTWDEKRVKWYVDGKPIAVCYHLPIVKQLYIVLSGLENGHIEII